MRKSSFIQGGFLSLPQSVGLSEIIHSSVHKLATEYLRRASHGDQQTRSPALGEQSDLIIGNGVRPGSLPLPPRPHSHLLGLSHSSGYLLLKPRNRQKTCFL